jgi:hypothetical protein
MCHMTLDLALPAEMDSDVVTCPIALNIASQLRWAPALSHVLRLRTSPSDWGRLHRCHVSYAFGPHLPTEVGSDAATCHMAPDLTSQLRRALTLPRVLWLQTSPPSWCELRCYHVCYGSGPHLPGERAPVLPSVLWLWTSAPDWGELRRCHVSYGSKSHLLVEVCSDAVTSVQLGTYVPNARTHVFKALDIRVIMSLQDVWAGITVNACKACRQTATVQLQCSVSTMDHSPCTATVPSDSTARCYTTNRV